MWLDIGGLLVILGPCTVLDIRKRKLPVIYLLVLLTAAFLTNLLMERLSVWEMALGILYGLAFLLVSILTKGAIGFGDGVMIASTGAWIGIFFVLPASILAFLSAGVFGLIYIKVRRLDRKTRLPFAPFLTGACLTLWALELVTGG